MELTPTPEQRRELMACPFCGADTVKALQVGETFIVRCSTCGASRSSAFSATDARNYWNRRPKLALSLVREVERLREGIQAALKALDDARIGEAGLVLMEAIGKGSNAKT